MEFKGTKGKWEYVDTYQHPTEQNEWHSVVQMPKYAISITNVKCVSKDEQEANAKLIASAPEMFELLKELSGQKLFQKQMSRTCAKIETLLTKITE